MTKEIMAGLEIHQQLETNKLFCNCPSQLRNDEPKFSVQRKLNPVVGETGEIDVAAQHEHEKNLTYEYQVYDTNCLVELDEEPPHDINENALKTAIQIALLVNCKIFPATQVMRKTVIDGSNTSGFQRTVLVAHDGFIETESGRFGIETIALEEDSARKISESENKKTYRLDRLGIPLVEITTKPDMKSAEQVKEVALKIGEILRSCNVKRGIGTIRQDLNINIEGHPRIEIKGFQDPKMMIETVEIEVKRQEKEIKNKTVNKEGEVRRANPDGTTDFLRPMPGAARMYPETDVKILKISRDLLNDSKKTLPKLLSENKKFLEEFGLNEDLVKLILKENKLEDFKFLSNEIKNPQLIAKTITLFLKEISTKEKKTIEQINEKLSLDVIESVLKKVDEGQISENDVKLVLEKIYHGEKLEKAIEKEDIDLEKEVKVLVKEKPNLSPNAYMGLIMAKFKGKVNGQEVMKALKNIVK